jgi:hypothetical protein
MHFDFSVPGTQLLGVNLGDLVFATTWAVCTLLMAAIFCYRMVTRR